MKNMIVLTALFLSTAAYAGKLDIANDKLEIGMSEQQADQIIGQDPSRIDLTRCETEDPKVSVACKWVFFGCTQCEDSGLKVLFVLLPSGLWVVNSWERFYASRPD